MRDQINQNLLKQLANRVFKADVAKTSCFKGDFEQRPEKKTRAVEQYYFYPFSAESGLQTEWLWRKSFPTLKRVFS
jgi:hypothetical protein